jgi:hypothetical protein
MRHTISTIGKALGSIIIAIVGDAFAPQAVLVPVRVRARQGRARCGR